MATKRTDGEDGPKRVTPYVVVESPGIAPTQRPRTVNPTYDQQTPVEARSRFERAAAQDSVPEFVEQATAEAEARAAKAEAEEAEAEAAEKAKEDEAKEVDVKHVAVVESTTHEASRAKSPAKP